jgi:nitrile hydratase accessory protein
MSVHDKLDALAAEIGTAPEHVFSAPWEARAFALAVGLSEAGHFSWDDFRARLIAEVRTGDLIRARDGTAAPGSYYEHFLRALERIVRETGLADGPDIMRRIAEIEAESKR